MSAKDAFRCSIGSEVRQLRSSIGLTQNELGEKLNLDAAYLSKIERGEKPIGLEKLFILLSICEEQQAVDFVLKVIRKIENHEGNT